MPRHNISLMPRFFSCGLILSAGLLCLAGCGGYNAPSAAATVTLTATSVNDTSKSSTATITVTSGAAAVSLTITDTPPTGVTLLSFEVNVTGAMLNPGSVDLLGGKGPTQIEVKQLE